MRSSGSKSLSVSEDELNAALAGEGRRGVRRRLVAISRILAGQSIRQAARPRRQLGEPSIAGFAKFGARGFSRSSLTGGTVMPNKG